MIPVEQPAPVKHQGLGKLLEHPHAAGPRPGEPDRLRLVPTGNREHYLSLCGEVDIALDTFPYNGMTTTCDLLWQGVPTVTLCDPAHVSRVGASLLGSMGLTQWVATTQEQYVQIAPEGSADHPALTALRAGLRQRMRPSPLTDGRRVAAQLKSAMGNAPPRFRGLPLVDLDEREPAQAAAHPQGLGDHLAAIFDRRGVARACELARRLGAARLRCPRPPLRRPRLAWTDRRGHRVERNESPSLSIGKPELDRYRLHVALANLQTPSRSSWGLTTSACGPYASTHHMISASPSTSHSNKHEPFSRGVSFWVGCQSV